MKKLLFIVGVFLVATVVTHAQETKFGVKAGVDFASIKVKVLGTTVTGSETGFFLGGFANLGLSDTFSVQPELLYVAIQDSNFLSVPILARYEIAKGFGLMGGPSLNYFTDAEEDQLKFNVDLGANYEITEQIDVNAKYSLGFGDVSVSGLFVGVGYSFN